MPNFRKRKGEEINMVIGKFMVGKEKHVVVKMDHATHTMPKADWKRLYGNLHPEKWKKEKRE